MPLHLNNVTLAGTMTREAEVSYTPKGKAVAKLSLAVNRVWKDEGGQKHEEVTFVDCEAWGRTAEVIEEYTGKGHTILVEGRLKQDTWEDKTSGQKRSKLKIVVEKFHFVSKPKGEDDDDERPPRQERRQREAPPARKPLPPDPDLDAPEEDDIPF
jgi:single-strand DNA-binding protein